MSNHYICNNCSDYFSEVESEYLCMKCENRFKLDEVKWLTSCNYKLAVKSAG